MEKEINWLLKEKYFGKQTKQFYKDVKRLEKGEPVDYVIGFTEFLGCKIDLSKKTLIPRPETEFWVEKAVSALLADKRQGLRCLDLFTGSGCVGVAVLSKTGILLCDIADSQPECISQIKINLRRNGINKKRYKIIKSDIFKNINKKYNFIFANPPYIPVKNKSKIQKSVLKYEPKKALFGGADGMFFIKKFLSQAKTHLNSGGVIYMEFDSSQKSEIKKLAKKYNYSKCEFFKDQYNKWRWVEIT